MIVVSTSSVSSPKCWYHFRCLLINLFFFSALDSLFETQGFGNQRVSCQNCVERNSLAGSSHVCLCITEAFCAGVWKANTIRPHGPHMAKKNKIKSKNPLPLGTALLPLPRACTIPQALQGKALTKPPNRAVQRQPTHIPLLQAWLCCTHSAPSPQKCWKMTEQVIAVPPREHLHHYITLPGFFGVWSLHPPWTGRTPLLEGVSHHTAGPAAGCWAGMGAQLEGVCWEPAAGIYQEITLALLPCYSQPAPRAFYIHELIRFVFQK